MKVPLVTKIIRLKYARAAGSLGDTGSGAAGRGGSGGGSSGASSGGGLSRGTLLSIAEKRLSQRGRIEMDMRTNTLIVTDLPEYVQAVDEIIAQLDKPEPMVEIEARIVIASRNFLRDLGTSLGGAVVDPRDGKTAFLQTTPLQLQPGSKLAPGGQHGGGGSGGGSGGGGSGGGSGGGGSGSPVNRKGSARTSSARSPTTRSRTASPTRC